MNALAKPPKMRGSEISRECSVCVSATQALASSFLPFHMPSRAITGLEDPWKPL